MSVLLKRTLLILVIVLALLISFIYLLVPDTLTVQNKIIVGCSAPGANRTIHAKWKEIFDQAFKERWHDEVYQYKLLEPLYNGSRIAILNKGRIDTSILSLLPLSSDSTILQWSVSLHTGLNPASRLIAYISMLKLEKDMQVTINHISGYLSKTSNVYGYDITHTTLTDTVLVSTEMTGNSYPTTSEVYTLISALRKYISASGVEETNYPMLNVSFSDSRYTTMVGVPINKPVPESGNIKIKRLIPISNKILTTEVQGDTSKIKEAYQKIELYMQDHFLSAPVIPYELIITDRSKQPDPTKWITRIIYPIA